MGGAAGHLNHPHDRRDLTFSDYREIITRGINGTLNKESELEEKVDGLNLQITYKQGRLKAARNKSEIVNPLTSQQLKDKFKDRGDIEKAFSLAIDDVESAFSKLPAPFLTNFFKDGLRFANIEIIYPPVFNIVSYGKQPYIQLLNVIEYDGSGYPIQFTSKIVQDLANLIDQYKVSNQKTFQIIPTRIIEVDKLDKGKSFQTILLESLNTLRLEFQLDFSNTVEDYHKAWWGRFIDTKFPSLPKDVKTLLINRWALEDRSERLTKGLFDNSNLYENVRTIDKELQKVYAKQNEEKFEKIILELGVHVLNTASNYLSTLTREEFKKQISKRILEIKAQAVEEDDKKAVVKYLEKIKNLGGMDYLIPIEGIIFTYKDEIYKLTGLFAPLNQLLGVFRYNS
jgi:hypothetical protein